MGRDNCHVHVYNFSSAFIIQISSLQYIFVPIRRGIGRGFDCHSCQYAAQDGEFVVYLTRNFCPRLGDLTTLSLGDLTALTIRVRWMYLDTGGRTDQDTDQDTEIIVYLPLCYLPLT